MVCDDFLCANLLLLFMTLFGCLWLFLELLGIAYAFFSVHEKFIVCA
jgi:hypothetical protein